MRTKRTHLFQGRDWISYRWTVAELYDVLDKIHDVCLCHQCVEGQSTQTVFFAPSMIELYDDLTSLSATAIADSIPAKQTVHTAPSAWIATEILQRQHDFASVLYDLDDDNPAPSIEALAVITTQIKNLVRQLDV